MEQPHNAYRLPPEWPEIHSKIQNTLNSSAASQYNAAEVALDHIKELKDESLANNTYYALSLGACSIMRHLSVPANKERVMYNMSRALVDGNNRVKRRYASNLQEGSQLYIGAPIFARHKFKELSEGGFGQKEFLQYDVATQIASNALIASLEGRLWYGNTSTVNTVLFRNLTISRLHEVSLVGLSEALHSLLLDKHVKRQSSLGKKTNTRNYAIPINHIATPQEIRELKSSHLHLSAQLASLYIGEFDALLNRKYYSIPEVITTVDRTVQFEPPPKPYKGVLHTKRQGCPALYVADLIPTLSACLIETVATLQEPTKDITG